MYFTYLNVVTLFAKICIFCSGIKWKRKIRLATSRLLSAVELVQRIHPVLSENTDVSILTPMSLCVFRFMCYQGIKVSRELTLLYSAYLYSVIHNRIVSALGALQRRKPRAWTHRLAQWQKKKTYTTITSDWMIANGWVFLTASKVKNKLKSGQPLSTALRKNISCSLKVFSAPRCHFSSLTGLRIKLSGFMLALCFSARGRVHVVFMTVCGGHSILHKQCQGWLISQGLCLLASLNGRP